MDKSYIFKQLSPMLIENPLSMFTATGNIQQKTLPFRHLDQAQRIYK